MSSTKKVFTVFGATGVQGGSVIDVLLSIPKLASQFEIKGVTRDPSKPSAQALKKKGVTPIKADANDLEQLKSALAGSYAVYAVTNYWEKADKALEVTQGHNIADACLAAGVTHLIWSALPHVTRLSGGKLKHVEHFDSKAEVREYIEGVKGDKLVASYFMPGFYMQNIKSMSQPDPESGVLTFAQPWEADKTQVGLLDAKGDSGKYVVGLLVKGLSDPASVNGLAVHGVSEWQTPAQMVAALTKYGGHGEVRFAEIPASVQEEMMGKSGMPAKTAKELTENMLLVRDYSYFGVGEEKNQSQSDKVLPEGVQKTSWVEFVKKNWPGSGEEKLNI